MDYKLIIAGLLAGEDCQKEELAALITAADFKMGDYALPCFKLAAKLKKSPPQIAAALAAKIMENKPDWLSVAEAVNGYLNIRLDRIFYARQVLNEIAAKGEDWQPRKANNKTVVLDYSSVNIAKEFHIGHLLTTAIGGSLYRVFKYLGYNAVGVNHIGDWGTQFGKLIAAYKKWGVGDSSMEGLSALYVRFHAEAEKNPALNDEAREWFKKIEDGDPEAVMLFNKIKEIPLKEIDKTYKRLGIQFDSYNGESFYNDKMQPVIDELMQKGLLTDSDGAKVVDLSGFGMPPCLILKSDGATLYATRDLAAAIYRKKTYDFDQNLYVVAYQQNLHFAQVFKVLELMGYDWAKRCVHVPFGMVSLEGQGALSTRKGNVVLLKDLLSTAVKKTLEIIELKNPDLSDKEKTAEEIGVGAVIFGALYNNRIKDMVFSFDKALNFEGETGPYVQYTHARCCSVLAKGEASDCFDKKSKKGNLEKVCKDNSGEVDFNELADDDSYELIRLLGAFESVVEESAAKYEPCVIARYLMDLSQSFNRFYIGHRIIGEDKRMMVARLCLTKCVKNVLKNGLKLILLNAPSQM